MRGTTCTTALSSACLQLGCCCSPVLSHSHTTHPTAPILFTARRHRVCDRLWPRCRAPIAASCYKYPKAKLPKLTLRVAMPLLPSPHYRKSYMRTKTAIKRNAVPDEHAPHRVAQNSSSLPSLSTQQDLPRYSLPDASSRALDAPSCCPEPSSVTCSLASTLSSSFHIFCTRCRACRGMGTVGGRGGGVVSSSISQATPITLLWSVQLQCVTAPLHSSSSHIECAVGFGASLARRR